MVKLGVMMGGLTGDQIVPSAELARYAEDLGFESIWFGEGRLMGSIVPHLTMALASTSRIKVGSGILPYRTRNVALLATTFKTLEEFAPGRVRMGLGAWWEPLATRVGLANHKPLTAMREIVTVSRRLLAGETVTFHGEFVNVTDIRFDSPDDDDGRAYDIPIYIGAVRPRMLALAGELCDGVLLDFLVPTGYTEGAITEIRRGAAISGRDLAGFDIPQLITCCIDDHDPKAAIDECKAFLTQYLGQQPHISEFAGADPAMVAEITRIVGWPTTRAAVRRAMELVPDSLVHAVTACGTTTQVVDKIEQYVEAGITEAVLVLRGNDDRAVLRSVAQELGRGSDPRSSMA